MITASAILFVFVLVVVLIIVCTIAIIVAKVSKGIHKATRTISKATSSVKEISKAVYGTDDIVEGIKRQEFEHSVTPKSVSDMTKYCLPKIVADFPEFNFEEMRERAKNVLNTYLFSIDEANSSHLSEGNSELKTKLAMQIKLLQDKNYTEHFERMKIHKCEIAGYTKANGRCIVTFQASIQYFHYIMEGTTLRNGRPDQLKQARYNIDLIYIQDRDLVENADTAALGVSCPNCDAPIPIGATQCPYCGSPVIAINLYAWTFSNVKEV